MLDSVLSSISVIRTVLVWLVERRGCNFYFRFKVVLMYMFKLNSSILVDIRLFSVSVFFNVN